MVSDGQRQFSDCPALERPQALAFCRFAGFLEFCGHVRCRFFKEDADTWRSCI